MSKRSSSASLWKQGPQVHKPQGFLNSTAAVPLEKPPSNDFLRARNAMLTQLKQLGITNDVVLTAMQSVPRHLFIDSAFAQRAYDNVALSIGFQQTISHPWVVARMLCLALDATPQPMCWLEIGTGCGYQAAVMSYCTKQVCSIERISGLHHVAQRHLAELGIKNVQLAHSDGTQGWLIQQGERVISPEFDAIVVAAAGIEIAPIWLRQLRIGGRLIAPVQASTGEQRLRIVDRTAKDEWTQQTLDSVQFVPLLTGLA